MKGLSITPDLLYPLNEFWVVFVGTKDIIPKGDDKSDVGMVHTNPHVSNVKFLETTTVTVTPITTEIPNKNKGIETLSFSHPNDGCKITSTSTRHLERPSVGWTDTEYCSITSEGNRTHSGPTDLFSIVGHLQVVETSLMSRVRPCTGKRRSGSRPRQRLSDTSLFNCRLDCKRILANSVKATLNDSIRSTPRKRSASSGLGPDPLGNLSPSVINCYRL